MRLLKAGKAQIMNLMDNFIDIYWDVDLMAGRPLRAPGRPRATEAFAGVMVLYWTQILRPRNGLMLTPHRSPPSSRYGVHSGPA